MGCGGSKSPHNNTVINQGLVVSIDNERTTAPKQPCSQTANRPEDKGETMFKKAKKELDEKKAAQEPATPQRKHLEELVKNVLSFDEEKTKEALLYYDKHANHQEELDHIVRIMQDTNRQQPERFARQLQDLEQLVPVDFLALLGGVEVSIAVYNEHLKSIGVDHVTDELFENPGQDQKIPATILHNLLYFWVNATDKSEPFSTGLAEGGMFPHLAVNVKNLGIDFDPYSDVFDMSLTILHNSAKFSQLRQHFRDIDLVHILIPILVKPEMNVKLLVLLTLSYIIDEKDNHLLLAQKSDLDFFLASVKGAWDTTQHRNSAGYTVEELLVGLGNIAQNDNNKKLLMEKRVLMYLKPILQTGSNEEKQEAAKVVWELAFNKENKQLMKADKELMQQLNTLKNSSHRGVAKACSGALWVLDLETKLKGNTAPSQPTSVSSTTSMSSRISKFAPPPPSAPSSGAPPPAPPPPPALAGGDVKGGQGHIMISYNWDNQGMMKQIRDSLRSGGFKVWMDIDNIKGSTLQAMAEAVEDASAVLVCMSQRYKDSPNCRTEAEYAFALHKPIIPLLLERGYKPDGWLGILRGSKLFFDFSGKYPYEKKVDELMKELGNKGKSEHDESDAPIVGKKVTPVGSGRTITMDVNSWSQKDVNDWINKNQLHKCPKLQNLTGENIKFLQKLSQRAPEFYFTYLKQDLGLTALNDLMHFSDAIDKLP